MPTMSRLLQPSESRIRLTTTVTGASDASRSSTRVRASRASPVGSAEPTTTTWSAAATASRVSWLRDRLRPRSASSSRLKPVSTTTSPTSRRAVEHDVEHTGPRLDPAVRPRQPGEHLEAVGQHATAPRERLGVQGARVDEPGGSEQSGDLVEHAEVLGDGTAVRDRRRRARSVARGGRARRRGRSRASYGQGRRRGRARRRSGPRSRLPPSGSDVRLGIDDELSGAGGARRPPATEPRSSSSTTATTPIRVRLASSPPTATQRTSWRSSCITASASRPGRSPATTATSTCPVVALASRSVRSTHRLSTWLEPPLSKPSAGASHGSPAGRQQDAHPVGHGLSPSWR